MVSGDIMPPMPSILAATIGVTFVGPKNLFEQTMTGFLCVNCHHVCHALEWLKLNNPIYEHITISTEHLSHLPLNDVPVEITSVAKHSVGTTLLAKETDTYVPDQTMEEQGRKLTHINLH